MLISQPTSILYSSHRVDARGLFMVSFGSNFGLYRSLGAFTFRYRSGRSLAPARPHTHRHGSSGLYTLGHRAGRAPIHPGMTGKKKARRSGLCVESDPLGDHTLEIRCVSLEPSLEVNQAVTLLFAQPRCFEPIEDSPDQIVGILEGEVEVGHLVNPLCRTEAKCLFKPYTYIIDASSGLHTDDKPSVPGRIRKRPFMGRFRNLSTALDEPVVAENPNHQSDGRCEEDPGEKPPNPVVLGRPRDGPMHPVVPHLDLGEPLDVLTPLMLIVSGHCRLLKRCEAPAPQATRCDSR